LSDKVDKTTEGLKPLTGGRFRFSCHKEISCFNKCCADLQLILTPYDILRIKNRLGLSSHVFLNKYTVPVTGGGAVFPMIRLRMREDDAQCCPFVSSDGCTIYDDRPGACRLYPIGRGASSGPPGGSGEQEVYFVVNEAHCLGFEQEREWTVEEWLADQRADHYNMMNRQWMEIVTSRSPRKGELTEDKLQMFYMTSYNLDRFRDFVLKTKFSRVFDLSEEDVAGIREDETILLELGMRWLKFALYGEETLRLNPLHLPPQ
jgi:Fe-S-cluster containining protein